jgi:hypothetical protein
MKNKKTNRNRWQGFVIVAVLFAVVGLMTACNGDDDNGDKNGTTYQIGDIGPGGGIIFYVSTGFTVQGHPPNFNTYTAKYLEAALSNRVIGTGVVFPLLSTQAELDDVVTGTGIGSGRRNTRLLLNANPDTQGLTTAIRPLEDGYDLNGLNDWFLPSKDELNLMRENLHLNGLGGFGGLAGANPYWSSSLDGSDKAWQQFISTVYCGDQATEFLNYSRRVRVVRAF